MKCNVCSEDKELNQFQTYWHSTQQKMRTRKQCTKCLYQIRLKRKNPDKYYENNPNYHKCNTCHDWKQVKDFYTSKDEIYSNRCRSCTRELDQRKRKEHLEQSCGSEKVKTKPNEYMDEYQKNCTFWMMKTMGYTFDDATGIWIKPGWKEVKDGKPYFPNIGKTKKIGVKVTQTMIEQMLELRKLGWGYNRIADKIGISDTTVFKYVSRYEAKIN
jgi:predicted transcriptional regulator